MSNLNIYLFYSRRRGLYLLLSNDGYAYYFWLNSSVTSSTVLENFDINAYLIIRWKPRKYDLSRGDLKYLGRVLNTEQIEDELLIRELKK